MKKLFLICLAAFALAWLFNIKVGNKPTRQWTQELWYSKEIQKTYTTVKDRIKALVNQEISLEDTFSSSSEIAKQKQGQNPQREQLNEKDQKALEKIIK